MGEQQQYSKAQARRLEKTALRLSGKVSFYEKEAARLKRELNILYSANRAFFDPPGLYDGLLPGQKNT